MTPKEEDYVQRAIASVEDGDPADRTIGYLRNALEQ